MSRQVRHVRLVLLVFLVLKPNLTLYLFFRKCCQRQRQEESKEGTPKAATLGRDQSQRVGRKEEERGGGEGEEEEGGGREVEGGIGEADLEEAEEEGCSEGQKGCR